MKKESFGKTNEGREVFLFILNNKKGQEMAVSNFGAAWVRAIVPDKAEEKADVVLGFDDVKGYLKNGSFFGVVVGPSANRIAGASIEIDGKEYPLDKNDNKVNNLHSHIELGYHKRVWEVKEEAENSVTFALTDNATMGFPGNKEVSVRYSLDDEGNFAIHYHISSDAHTVINPTHHAYFNLKGDGSGRIENHILKLYASKTTPVGEGLIPTGEIKDVKGTPFDFTEEHRIGERIDADDAVLKLGGGYDHNFVIDDYDGSLKPAARVTEPESGRVMEVYTTLPGIQFYAGTFIGRETGKNGHIYDSRSGFALESQYYPDCIHRDNFPQCIFGGDMGDYDSETVYKFL